MQNILLEGGGEGVEILTNQGWGVMYSSRVVTRNFEVCMLLFW
jgi:hypothetical protein